MRSSFAQKKKDRVHLLFQVGALKDGNDMDILQIYTIYIIRFHDPFFDSQEDRILMNGLSHEKRNYKKQ